MGPCESRKPNNLINEKSPYLLQHAFNPVNWYPWSSEAFIRAKTENKPIFLSIGYSTCHWCHVMERESFENEEIASLLNRVFISIKVDREERPDIDGIYMRACEMINGSGGWPLTVIMTPEKEPFFAATYMPAFSRHNFLGLAELIMQIENLWLTQYKSVQQSAEKFTEALQQFLINPASELPDRSIEDTAYEKLKEEFDAENGGFGPAPKFPNPQILSFLLRYHKRTKKHDALSMVTKSLDSMRMGGIFDQIGYGFHRYSTDECWCVPHFEKMLYDQAMLIITYTETYLVTGDPFYSDTVREIIAYVTSKLKDPSGGFYCAEDADIDGEEGAYYLWSDNEIRDILTPDEYLVASKLYSLQPDGNVNTRAGFILDNKNILHLKHDPRVILQSLEIDTEKQEMILKSIREKLMVKRSLRKQPGIDDKILTDWNGLMIASLAIAARAFDSPEYRQYAIDATEFILSRQLSNDGTLFHRFRDNESAIPGFSDDYAFMAWALFELYETTFEVRYLDKSISLINHLYDNFVDYTRGGLFDSSKDSEKLLFRSKEAHDAPYPSGNAIAAIVLFKLALISADQFYYDRAISIVKTFSGDIKQIPQYFATFLSSIDFWTLSSSKVVLSGHSKSYITKLLLSAINRTFLPSNVVVLRPTEVANPAILSTIPVLKEYISMDGKTAGYVCRNGVCNEPVTDAGELVRLLKNE